MTEGDSKTIKQIADQTTSPIHACSLKSKNILYQFNTNEFVFESIAHTSTYEETYPLLNAPDG